MIERAKPVLFNTDMVKAILDGRKSCTRRIVKPQPQFRNNETGTFVLCDDGSFQLKVDGYNTIYDYPVTPRYYKNDILYVRETWRISKCEMCENPTESYQYLASVDPRYKDVLKWKPSIHMPKEAARIFLRVTNVRLERLQDMSEQEALSEGIYFDDKSFVNGFTCCKEHEEGVVWDTAVNCFRWYVWNKTLKKSELDLYGWDANPWVWVYEFERIETE